MLKNFKLHLLLNGVTFCCTLLTHICADSFFKKLKNCLIKSYKKADLTVFKNNTLLHTILGENFGKSTFEGWRNNTPHSRKK